MRHHETSADRVYGLIGAAAVAFSLTVIAAAGWIAGTAIGAVLPTAEATAAFVAPTSHQIDVMGLTRLAEQVGE